jgi:phage baseplate assembly protein gpV
MHPQVQSLLAQSNITSAQFSSSQTYTANVNAGISLIGTQFNAKVDNDTTAFDGAGNIMVKAGANLTTPNIGAATGTSISLTGNVTGGNVLTGGVVSATGNVTGNYFLGNGTQLTGILGNNVNMGT